MITRRSKLAPPDFGRPYYRAHLRCRRNDDGYSQHSVLLQHERNGHDVYYATPRFHRLSDLDNWFTSGLVIEHSAFFRPTDIGDLTDEAHHVAYCSDLDVGWLRSDPIKMPLPLNSQAFFAHIEKRLAGRARAAIDFDQVLNDMVSSAEEGSARDRERDSPMRRQLVRRRLQDAGEARRMHPRIFASRIRDGRTPRQAAALFARLWLNAELLAVS